MMTNLIQVKNKTYKFIILVSILLAFSCSKPFKSKISQNQKDSIFAECTAKKLFLIGHFENELECAVYSNNLKKLVELHQKNMPLNYIRKDKSNLLHIASKYLVDIDILEYLIKNKVSVNQQNNSGDLPLNSACRSGNLTAVEFLLKNGSKIDVEKNHSPIGDAIQASNLQIIKILVKNNAELNDKDFPPLFIAMGVKWKECVNFLLNNKASPNAVDEKGWNALHFAVFFEYDEIIDLLLQFNCDKNARSKKSFYKGEIGADDYISIPKNVTPLEMAELIGNYKIINRLK